MQIYVGKEGQRFGPYSLEELKEHLQAGRFAMGDLGWYEGAPGWIPLDQIPGVAPGTQPPPLPSQGAPSPAGMVSDVLG